MRKLNYTYRKLQLHEILNEDLYIIPQFQRKLVWDEKRRKSFIKNLLDGDPFGVILVRVREDNKFELNDGLQRITTIQDFNRNPFKYLSSDDINIDLVKKLIIAYRNSKKLPIDQDYIKENLQKWRALIFDSIKSHGLEAKTVDVLDVLDEEFSIGYDRDVYSTIEEILRDFTNFRNLDNLEIVAIDYIGPKENIAKVFYNLNTTGVKLGTYDTLTARWSNNKFVIEDEEFIDIVLDMYDELEKSSRMESDVTDESLKDEGITLSEYCQALGVIMREEKNGFDILFGKNNDTTDPLGYEILALLLTNMINNRDGMYDKLKDVSPEFLLDLKDTIKESLEYIVKSLEPVLVGKNESHIRSDSNYLIYHMVVSYIKEYYEIDTETENIHNRETSFSRDDFKKYAPLHYFYDCITQYWNENRQTTNLKRDLVDERKRHKYWYNISNEDWEVAIEKFMNSQDELGPTIPQENKLFIDFLTKLRILENRRYEDYFTEENISNEKFPLDFEHIVPRKAINDQKRNMSDEQKQLISISAVGNLCYLTSRDNRSKKNTTVYEYLEGRPLYVEDDDFKECVLYPSKEELRFKDYDVERFLEGYNKFIEERQEKLKDEFLRLINKYY